jgi:hypothetical protein
VAEQSLDLRRQQIVAAEAIIAEHVTDFQETLARSFNRDSHSDGHSPLGETHLRASEL